MTDQELARTFMALAEKDSLTAEQIAEIRKPDNLFRLAKLADSNSADLTTAYMNGYHARDEEVSAWRQRAIMAEAHLNGKVQDDKALQSVPKTDLKREVAIAELKREQLSQCIEAAHINADDILCNLLTKLGYADVVAEYKQVDKWFA